MRGTPPETATTTLTQDTALLLSPPAGNFLPSTRGRGRGCRGGGAARGTRGPRGGWGYGDHVRNSVGFRNFTEALIKPMVIEVL